MAADRTFRSPWHCWFSWNVLAVLIPGVSRCACRNPSLPIVRFKQMRRQHPSGQTKPGLCSRFLPCSLVNCERAVRAQTHARAPPSHVYTFACNHNHVFAKSACSWTRCVPRTCGEYPVSNGYARGIEIARTGQTITVICDPGYETVPPPFRIF